MCNWLSQKDPLALRHQVTLILPKYLTFKLFPKFILIIIYLGAFGKKYK